MTGRYAENYLILGIQPGATWEELRWAYKKQINAWHPDRFQQDKSQKHLAEEKTKNITQAYNELAEYHKRYGALPLQVEMRPAPDANDLAPQSTHGFDTVAESQDTAPSATNATTVKPQGRQHHKRTPRSATVIALAGAIYLSWQLLPWELFDGPPEKVPQETTDIQQVQEENINSHQPATTNDKYFSVGSQLGEVYAIHGVPTKTEKDIWYYGNSKVYFSNGRVTRWEETTDHPLQTRVTVLGDLSGTAFFSKGSSKEDVLAVQGTPDRKAGNVWEYGPSRVYFDNNRVKGWHESPLNPLKVHR
jgi:hypothetical protein